MSTSMMDYKNKFDPRLSCNIPCLKCLLGCLNFHLYRCSKRVEHSKNLPSQFLSPFFDLQ